MRLYSRRCEKASSFNLGKTGPSGLVQATFLLEQDFETYRFLLRDHNEMKIHPGRIRAPGTAKVSKIQSRMMGADDR
jgi:hypothetical protein